MSPPQGSVTVAKRSLKHFAVGRVASAVVGITTLLMLVRVLDRADYGLYIALMAGFEIAQLAASPGAYAVVFRYWPEMRQAQAVNQLSRLTAVLAAYRFGTLAAVGALFVYFSADISNLLGSPGHSLVIQIFAVTFVFESASRLLDAQFESLLQQGTAQASVLFRNGIKLSALIALSAGGSQPVPLLVWVTAEAVTSLAGWVVSTFLMHRCVRGMSAGMSGSIDMSYSRLKRFSIPTYTSQVIYLCSGTEMVKLVLGKLVGSVGVAPFGFAAALSATIQRYLPSFLLVGWLRPLFIASSQSGKSSTEISALASAVVKLNLLVLAPIVTAIAVAGPSIIQQLAGGRLPEAEYFLYFFIGLLMIQSIRAVIALLGVVYELGNAGLRATIFSLVGICVGSFLFFFVGVWGFCLGLIISELVWAQTMLAALRQRGTIFRLPWHGLAKLLISAIAAAGAVLAVARIFDIGNIGRMAGILSAAAAAVLCLAICATLKPFTPQERELINKLLPGRLFIW